MVLSSDVSYVGKARYLLGRRPYKFMVFTNSSSNNSTNFRLPPSKLQDWEKTWVLYTFWQSFPKKDFIEMILAGGLSRIGNARQTYCLLFWRKWPFFHDSTGKCYNINHISRSDDHPAAASVLVNSEIRTSMRHYDNGSSSPWMTKTKLLGFGWHYMRLSLLR